MLEIFCSTIIWTSSVDKRDKIDKRDLANNDCKRKIRRARMPARMMIRWSSCWWIDCGNLFHYHPRFARN